MTIEIPPMKIVSDNERMIPVIRRSETGKMYPVKVLSTEYRNCLEDLIKIMRPQIPSGWKPSNNIVVEIFAHTYKDTWNFLKIIGEALEAAGVVTNDRYITTSLIVKYPVKRGQPDVVKMRVVNLED